MLTSFAGSDIFGESYGAGTPYVLALHGWARDHSDFAATLAGDPELGAIAVDLPGFGGTPAPENAWGSPEYAAALVPLFDHLDDRVIVLAHSFGGRVAVHLAGLLPERVGGLVLTGVPLFRASPSVRKSPVQFRLVRNLARRGLVSEAVLEKYRYRYGSADYRAASGVIREILVTLLNEDYAPAVKKVTCPVELVWGDKDTAAPLVVAETIRDTLPNGANLVVLPDTGHMTPLLKPAELRLAVERLRP